MAAYSNLGKLKHVFVNNDEFHGIEVSAIYRGSQKLFPIGEKSNEERIFEQEKGADWVEPTTENEWWQDNGGASGGTEGGNGIGHGNEGGEGEGGDISQGETTNDGYLISELRFRKDPPEDEEEEFTLNDNAQVALERLAHELFGSDN